MKSSSSNSSRLILWVVIFLSDFLSLWKTWKSPRSIAVTLWWTRRASRASPSPTSRLSWGRSLQNASRGCKRTRTRTRRFPWGHLCRSSASIRRVSRACLAWKFSFDWLSSPHIFGSSWSEKTETFRFLCSLPLHRHPSSPAWKASHCLRRFFFSSFSDSTCWSHRSAFSGECCRAPCWYPWSHSSRRSCRMILYKDEVRWMFKQLVFFVSV